MDERVNVSQDGAGLGAAVSINVRERIGEAVNGMVAWLNGPGHAHATMIFAAIVVSHWVEHVVQAVQIFVLHWPRDRALGALGLAFPWLVSSEVLHYGHALFMLVGLILLRPAIVAPARAAWDLALGIQVWHHFEHVLLFGQALTGFYLFGASVPMSILQLVAPRAELHLVYNAIVTGPMVLAMIYHIYRPATGRVIWPCTCARLSFGLRPRAIGS